jgi:hypothetical protein
MAATFRQVLVSRCSSVGVRVSQTAGAVSALRTWPARSRIVLKRPTEVTLVLDDRELRAEQTVYSERGSSVRTVFSIPLTSIIDVGASLRGEPGGLVLTGPSGLSSSLTDEEYVTLTLRAGDRIEAILLKVERQQSAGIAARIESAADKALAPPTSRLRRRNVRSSSSVRGQGRAARGQTVAPYLPPSWPRFASTRRRLNRIERI